MKNDYDIIIIGAGNGGLAAALTSVINGKKTLIVEKNSVPGGVSTSFVRGRFEFEASLHELCDYGTKDNPGKIQEMFKEFGIDEDIHFHEVIEAFRVINTNNTEEDYTLPFGIDNFIAKLEEYVPGSIKSVTKLFEVAEEIDKALDYLSESKGKMDIKVLIDKYPSFVKFAPLSLKKGLNSLRIPLKAKQIISTYWSYLGASWSELSFVHYVEMFYLYIKKSAVIPETRSHEISMAMVSRFEELGGEVVYNTSVKEMLVEEDIVYGVVLDNDKTLYARSIIADISPNQVYQRMIKNPPEKAIKLINARKLGARGFSIYLGLNRSPEELGLKNYSYFLYNSLDSDEAFNEMKKIEQVNQVVVCLNNVLPKCSKEGTTILYFTSLYFEDCFGEIVTGNNYFELKDKMAARFIKSFEDTLGVNIHDYIEEIEIATPVTYARYLNSPEGSIYGYQAQKYDNLLPRIMNSSKENYLRQLYFCGGYAERLSGYSSAFNSGKIAALRAVKDLGGEDYE